MHETPAKSPRSDEHLELWNVGDAEVLAYRVADLVRVVGLGRTMLYGAIRDGDLKARKYRSATLVLREDLVMFLEGLPYVSLASPVP